MSSWAPEDLQGIAASDDLHVAPFRPDGTTYGTLTWIWSVVVGDRLYVRAYNSTSSRWYTAATSQHAGRIQVAGSEHDVIFTAADPAVNDEIDDAHRAKYSGSAYLPPMLTAKTRAATVRIDPA